MYVFIKLIFITLYEHMYVYMYVPTYIFYMFQVLLLNGD